MTKVIHCKDVGFDCDAVVRADTEEKALQDAAKHAKAVHGLEEFSPAIVEQVKAVIREEPE